MPFKDPEAKKAYDREYRRRHRAQARHAKVRYNHSWKGLLTDLLYKATHPKRGKR